MGNCATKPKVLNESDKPPASAPALLDYLATPEKPKEDENVAAEARWRDKGKEILIEGDDEVDEGLGDKRRSLSRLFKEDELSDQTMEREKTEQEPMNQQIIKNQTGLTMEKEKTEPEPTNQQIIKNQTGLSIGNKKTKPEPTNQEINENPTDQSMEREKTEPEPTNQQTIKSQTGLSMEKEETEPEQTNQRTISKQTGPSLEAHPKLPPEGFVLEVTDVKLPEVSTESKPPSETMPAGQHTPYETPEFADAQEKTEPERTFVEAAMTIPTTDHKQKKIDECCINASAQTDNNAKENVFVDQTENKRSTKDVYLDEKHANETALSELEN